MLAARQRREPVGDVETEALARLERAQQIAGTAPDVDDTRARRDHAADEVANLVVVVAVLLAPAVPLGGEPLEIVPGSLASHLVSSVPVPPGRAPRRSAEESA